MSVTSIRLETSSICQLRCPSCPTTSKAIQPAVGSGFLKLSDFKALLDANSQLQAIELSNYGEIFLNPELLEILKLGHERGLALSCSNGANLNQVKPEVLEALVRYQLRAMTVSLDGASQESYAQYRVNGDYERVIANVRAIQRHKEEQKSEFPRLTWQFIAFGHNQHEIAKARALAAELGMGFYLKLTWDDAFSPLKDPDALRAELGAASRKEYEAQHGKDLMQGICQHLWDTPQINWDGKVLGCGRNFWGHFGSGNAFKDGLEAVLNSEAIQYAKAMLRGLQPARADIPCSSCAIYLGMQQRQQWLEWPPEPVLPAAPSQPSPFQRLRSRLHLGRFLPWRRGPGPKN